MIRRLILALAVLALVPGMARAQTDQTDIAHYAGEVDDLTAIRQIKHMQARWGHMAMAGNWHGMAAMATPDAEVETRGGIVSGRGGVEAWLRSTQGGGQDGMPAGRMNVRLYLSPVITLSADGQKATGRWHEVALTAEIGQQAGWQGLTHVIDYVNTPEGWRIAHIRPYMQFAGSYADGWMHDAATLERAPYHYTPDQAGTVLTGRAAPAAEIAGRDQNALDLQADALLAQNLAQNTVNAFGYYLDRGMYDDIADLFADDAKIELGGTGSWNGAAGVRAFLTRFGPAGMDEGELNDHVQLMPMANVAADGSMALIRNIDLSMTGQHGGEGFWQVTMQTFMLRPDDEGHWRIALMHYSPIMRSTYEDGWSNPLSAAPELTQGGAPDGETRLGSLDFRSTAYAVPPLGENLIMPARGEAATMPRTINALAHAEAFDGAENISNAYGYYIDQFAWRKTGGLFAHDGWKELSYIGTFIGQDRVIGSMIQRYGEGGPNDAFQAIHQKTQPYVTVLDDAGQRAFVRSRLFQFNSSSDGSGSWIGGIYENQVIKEDGIWRIHGMDLDYVWLGDYATGWMGIDPAASARFGPGDAAIAAFAPDAPLRGEVFAPYPAIRPMGFHFTNPVSGRAPPLQLQWSDGHRQPAAEQ
ncbi:hypothetical protein GCM10009127_26230 [Alteraurantiacibacter aestuarii]|uniref:nuclear transport factor 2 family protein n=1 Tax=Alteraurantiacibacter aestuarii TaxID=650004 RepID=UPI0031DBECC5